ncbi:MAG: histidine kinase dimerization/phospho-acceptor domain-containing protein, partial [Pseudomonadota bacterium]
MRDAQGARTAAAGLPKAPRRKWRPSLGQVTLVVLGTVVMLPLVGLFFFRVIENQLIRETESELIAQTAVLAQVFAREVAADPAPWPEGPALPPGAKPDPANPFDEILPSLDLTSAYLLPTRPDGIPAPPAQPRTLAVGARLAALARDVQRVTLAGFRFLDATGRVIGGPIEVGLSFADVPEVERALAGRYTSVIRSRVRDRPAPPLYSISRGTGIRVFVAMPVTVEGRVAGVVYTSRTPNNIVKYFYAERFKLVTAALIVVAVMLLLAFFFIRILNRPVAALIAWTGRVRSDVRAPPPPLAHHGTREIAQLAAGFQDLAAQLHRRSDYIATFAAHVGHELKSPLTTIQGAAELIRDQEMSGPERARLAGTIVADADRLSRLLTRLRDLARAENAETGGEVTLADLAEPLARAHPTLEIEVEGDAPLPLSPENGLIVLGHLLANAAEHGASEVQLTAEPRALTVRDNGEGVSPGNRARIFEAFFTTKRE